jgi:hypothetical protein
VGVTNVPDKFYERLGVPRTATPQQIKRAYRKKASAAHPDHGGSEERFRELTEAYKTLFDPEARKKYDRGEHDASRGSATPPPSPDDSAPLVPIDPYVTPNKIEWRVDDAHPPAPVTVRLSNRYGVAIGGECYPENWSGPHWQIAGGDEILEGNDLYDFIIAPNHVHDLSAGTHREEVRFMVDDRPTIVTINFFVSTRSASTRSTDDRPPPSRASWPPTERTTPRSPLTPERRPRTRRRLIAFVLLAAILGVVIALTRSSTPAPRGSATAPTVVQHAPSNTPQSEGSSSPQATPDTNTTVQSNAPHSRPRTNRAGASAQKIAHSPRQQPSTIPQDTSTPPVEVVPGRANETAPPPSGQGLEAGGGTSPPNDGTSPPAEATGGASHGGSAEPPVSAGN